MAHFDAKDEVAQYIRALGVPATFFMPGFYMQNISGGMLMRKDAGGTYRLTFPAPGHTLVPLLDARADTGKYVKAALKKAALTLGREIYGAPAYITIQDAVAAVARIHPDTAAGASFTEVSADDYRAGLTGSGLPDHAAQELLENMQFMTEYGYFGQKDLAWSNQVCVRHALHQSAGPASVLTFTKQILDEKASTWEEFLKTVQL